MKQESLEIMRYTCAALPDRLPTSTATILQEKLETFPSEMLRGYRRRSHQVGVFCIHVNPTNKKGQLMAQFNSPKKVATRLTTMKPVDMNCGLSLWYK